MSWRRAKPPLDPSTNRNPDPRTPTVPRRPSRPHVTWPAAVEPTRSLATSAAEPSHRTVAPSTAIGSPLVDAHFFTIPMQLLRETLEVVRRAGQDGGEAFVTWGGRVDEHGGTVNFTSCLVPRQTAHRTRKGLLVTVDGQALFELNRELYVRGELLAAQVHSHPGDAYHSETDDCFSLVTLTGALSVVIPRFGFDGLNNFEGWAWYRMTGQGDWSSLGADDQVQIVHDGAS